MDAYNNVGIDSIETAKNLKKLRIENNLKLKQVRDAIGLSAEQTVCSWESKTHPKLPSIDNALNLARLYGVRLDQLYKTRPVKTGSPEKVDQEIRDRITISMRMGEFEEFFDDMRMERESICGPFVAAEAQREDGTWEPETIPLPDELTYFSKERKQQGSVLPWHRMLCHNTGRAGRRKTCTAQHDPSPRVGAEPGAGPLQRNGYQKSLSGTAKEHQQSG